MAILGLITVNCEVIQVKDRMTDYGLKQDILINTNEGMELLHRYVKDGQIPTKEGQDFIEVGLYNDSKGYVKAFINN